MLVVCLSIPTLASCDTLSKVLEELETFEYDSDNMGGGYQPPSRPDGDDMFDPDFSFTPTPPTIEESATEDDGVPAETLPAETLPEETLPFETNGENETFETTAPDNETTRGNETNKPEEFTTESDQSSAVEPTPDQTEKPDEPELETKF